MIRDAVTCDAPDCLAVLLERDDAPEDQEFEEAIAAAGWISRPAVLAVPGRDDNEVLGHVCPACVAGRGPVLELGECPVCTGRTTDREGGAVCLYCRTWIAWTDTDD